MTRLVQIFNDLGAPVTSGVTVASSAWEDAAGGTPTASVAHVATGTWRVSVPDAATPRGPAGVTLAYNPGSGVVNRMVRVEDSRLAASAITDAALAAGSAVERTVLRFGGSKAEHDYATGVSTFYTAAGVVSFTETTNAAQTLTERASA